MAVPSFFRLRRAVAQARGQPCRVKRAGQPAPGNAGYHSEKGKGKAKRCAHTAGRTSQVRRLILPMIMRTRGKITTITQRIIASLCCSRHVAGWARKLAPDAMGFFLPRISTRLLITSCYQAKKPRCEISASEQNWHFLFFALAKMPDGIGTADACGFRPWLSDWPEGDQSYEADRKICSFGDSVRSVPVCNNLFSCHAIFSAHSPCSQALHIRIWKNSPQQNITARQRRL